jgi:uncharacterized phiE125 gp8 family phage protein
VSTRVVVQPAIEPLTVSETLRHCRIDQSNQELAPGALTAALVSPAAAGNLSAGVYRWRVTFGTADGETEAGVISAAVTVSNPAVNGRAALTNIPTGGDLTTYRRLWRTVAGGSDYLLLATLADNTTTSYTDNIADASLGVGAPTTNTTSDPEIARLIKSAREAAEQEIGRALITQTIEKTFDSWPYNPRTGRNVILLPPLQSVVSITYVDLDGETQTLAADQYLVDSTGAPSRITPAYGVAWPSIRDQNNAVTVRFVAGYGDTAADVPGCIKTWMLMRIKTLVDNPSGIGSIQFGDISRSYVDGLLDSERVYVRT